MRPVLLSTCCLLLSMQAVSQTLQWAKSMGGTEADFGSAVAADAAGNVFSTGSFKADADFDPGAGTFPLSMVPGMNGNYDAFISKLDASGNFAWAKHFGGIDGDAGTAITVDAAGSVFTTGFFTGTIDFDPGAGVTELSAAAGPVFISKLDNDGNFVWARNFGNGGRSEAIHLDAAGNIYTTGNFKGVADFDPGAGTFELISGGSVDCAFVSKLDNAGNFLWARQLGTPANGAYFRGTGIGVDADGNVYTSGTFQGTGDFNPGTAVSDLSNPTEGADIYFSKLNAAGEYVWAVSIGGTQAMSNTGLAVDPAGNLYTCGTYMAGVTFGPGPGSVYHTSLGGNTRDMYIAKLDATGAFQWTRSVGGSQGEDVNALVIDDFGYVYTTGHVEQVIDYDPGPGTANTPGGKAFVLKMDNAGEFTSVIGTGGFSYAYGEGIAVDNDGRIYLAGGYTGGGDFDPGTGTTTLTSEGGYDIFVSKWTQGTVGIGDTNAAPALSLYPVPATDRLVITSDAPILSVTCIGARGERSALIVLGNSVDVSRLAPGVYILEVGTPAGTSARTFQKM